MCRLAIIDDDKMFMDVLKQEILSFCKGWTISCIHDVQGKYDFDAYFIDIELGSHKNGFTIAADIKKIYPDKPIIYISSHESYALDGYEADAFYFISKSKLKQYLPLAIKKLEHHFLESKGSLFLYDESVFEYQIPYKNLIYLYSQANYVYAKTSDGRNYHVRSSITKLKNELPSCFIQIIAGIIVNLDYIKNIDTKTLKVYLVNDEHLHVSRNRVKDLVTMFHRRFFS